MFNQRPFPSPLIFRVSAAVIVAGLLYVIWDGGIPISESASDIYTRITGKPVGPRQKGRQTSELPRITSEPEIHAEEIARIRTLVLSSGPLKRGQIRNEEVVGLLRRLAEIDPEGAIRFAFEQEGIHGDYELPGELFAGWLDSAQRTARRWFEMLPSGNLRSRVAPTIVSLLAAQDPQRALAIQASLHGEQRRRSVEILFGEWTKHSPQNATSQALQLKSVEDRDIALAAVAAKWAASDLEAAKQWQAQLPWGGKREPALRGMLAEWAAQTPESLARYAIQVPNEGVQREMVNTALDAWVRQQPLSAAQWVLTQLPQRDHAPALRRIVFAWADRDLKAAANWVNGLTAGPVRDLSVAVLSQYLLPKEPEAAAEWAVSISNSNEREKQTQVVFQKWSARDPIAARKWFGR